MERRCEWKKKIRHLNRLLCDIIQMHGNIKRTKDDEEIKSAHNKLEEKKINRTTGSNEQDERKKKGMSSRYS